MTFVTVDFVMVDRYRRGDLWCLKWHSHN